MKERPILFSAPMVRALLAGTKTQTRRIAKLQPTNGGCIGHFGCGMPFIRNPDNFGRNEACPYGQPGDRLWVRETWGVISHTFDASGGCVEWTPDRPATAIREMPFGQGYYSGHVIYAADGPNEWDGDDDGGGESRSAWHPSIHMPRRASRITLEITGIRVERLQDISEADAIAEGIVKLADGGYGLPDGSHYHAADPRISYLSLWGAINGQESVDANQFVWVIEFKRLGS